MLNLKEFIQLYVFIFTLHNDMQQRVLAKFAFRLGDFHLKFLDMTDPFDNKRRGPTRDRSHNEMRSKRSRLNTSSRASRASKGEAVGPESDSESDGSAHSSNIRPQRR